MLTDSAELAGGVNRFHAVLIDGGRVRAALYHVSRARAARFEYRAARSHRSTRVRKRLRRKPYRFRRAVVLAMKNAGKRREEVSGGN